MIIPLDQPLFRYRPCVMLIMSVSSNSADGWRNSYFSFTRVRDTCTLRWQPTLFALPEPELLKRNQQVTLMEATQHQHCKKGFVILTTAFLTRIATVDMVLWDDTRIVPCDSQLWTIQCTWSSYRNN